MITISKKFDQTPLSSFPSGMLEDLVPLIKLVEAPPQQFKHVDCWRICRDSIDDAWLAVPWGVRGVWRILRWPDDGSDFQVWQFCETCETEFDPKTGGCECNCPKCLTYPETACECATCRNNCKYCAGELCEVCTA